MRINHLCVENFRGFESREFSLHPRFNVLIGDNATGKTALLRALRVAIASWFLGIKDRNTVGIRPDDVRLVGKAYEAGEYTFEEQYPVVVSASGSFDELNFGPREIEWTRTLEGPNGRTTRRHAKQIKDVAREADQSVRRGEDTTLPLIAYYSTSRLYLEPRRTQRRRQSPDKRDLSRFVGYRDCIDKRLDTKALTQWIKRQSWMAFQEGNPSVLFQRVQRAIVEIVEGARAIQYDPEREEVIVVFEDGRVYPLDHLSDGQRTTLTLVGDLAVRAARLNPHLGDEAIQQTPGVVLIDELEMHLHPTWQRHIVDDLNRVFPNIQFVATTHSPQVISEIDDGKILLLERTASGIEVNEEEAYGLDSNWVLQHIMKVSPRPQEIEEQLSAAEDALSRRDFEQARDHLRAAWSKTKRESGTMARLESKIDTLEMLSNDEDNSQAGE